MEMDAGAVGVGVLNKGLGRGMIIVLGTLSRRVLSWLYSRKAIPPKILCRRRKSRKLRPFFLKELNSIASCNH
jgi:hypothetical protein